MTDQFLMRSARWSDLPRIMDLRNASSQNTRGTNVTAIHWQKRHWYDSSIDLETDTLLTFTLLTLAGEKLIAYAELTSEPPFILHEMAGAVHPDYRGKSIGTQQVRWAEKRAQANIDSTPERAAIFIQNSIFDNNQPGRDLFENHGFSVVRDFVHLKIDMSQKPADPVSPDSIEVQPLQPTDWDKVGPVLYEAFNDHWGNVEYDAGEPEVTIKAAKPDHRQTDPEAFDSAYFNSPDLCFVAWDGDEVAGSCLCNAKTVEYPEAGYIGSLSVRRPWRQRGLGRALTLHALNAFYERSITQVFTDTDSDSLTKAYRVYQKADMQIFRREYVYEKTIRPGRDYVKREMFT